MVFASLLFMHALAANRLDRGEFRVLHTRPSKIVEQIKGLESEGLTVTADDAKSIIVMVGPTEDIKTMTTYLSLFDIARRKVTLNVGVDSVVDKMSLESSATVLNNQLWKTSDDETGVEVSVSPRINDDNTITLYVEFKTATLKKATMVVRISEKQMAMFSVGKDAIQYVDDPKHMPRTVSPIDPKVRISANLSREGVRPESFHPGP